MGLSPLFVGCASIINGELQTVNIKSTPTDAMLTVYDLRSGAAINKAATPQLVTLNRGVGYFKEGKYKAVIEKDGYEKQEFNIEGNVNGWYAAGNLIFGGLIGWFIVDPLTGAMWSLDPDVVEAKLVKKGDKLTEAGAKAPATAAGAIDPKN